ncbi:hypothetical protein JNK62_03520 [bacterium]|nr:hypothetical protein [bacterium]
MQNLPHVVREIWRELASAARADSRTVAAVIIIEDVLTDPVSLGLSGFR